MEQGGAQALAQLRTHQLHPALVFRYLALGLLGGFVIGYWIALPWTTVLVALVLVGLFGYVITGVRPVAFVVVGILVALLRGNGLVPPPPDGSFLGAREFTAQVAELPRVSERAVRYVVEPKGIAGSNRVLITSRPWPNFTYGDTLRVRCGEVESVTFASYTNRGIWRQCAFPELGLVASSAPGLRSWLLLARREAGDIVRRLTPEPYATLATGMLWGDDAGLPRELTEAFRRTGTTHLLAVSGFNVMVLSRVLFWLFIALGLWRRQASLAVLVLIGLFVLFSGAEPAVVRAGTMGSILLLGQLLARRADKLNVLSGTAAAMLLLAPRLVVDLGFQLSFAAMAGLMYLAPILQHKFSWLPSLLGLRQSAAETVAATLVTTPLILGRVDQLSLVAPLANLLVAPVIVLVYWFGLSLLPLSALGSITALPAAWLLTAVLVYLTSVVNWLANLPWAAAPASTITWVLVVLGYLVFAWWLVPQENRVKLWQGIKADQ
ncbi:MAG: ComEC/Rec2 family competence protein [Candidatus Veblenbacteria bacterium]|nr:ComEC/Rec2 family competence protein [Candidatus Veblenbacteria bacterium]